MFYTLNYSLNICIDYNDKIVTYYDGNLKKITYNNFDLLVFLIEFYKDIRIKDDIPKSYLHYEQKEIIKCLKQMINLRFIIESDYDIHQSRMDTFLTSFNKVDQYKFKINEFKILIIGCGTLGSSAALSLAKIGIKKIDFVDFDVVTPNILDAQIIFKESDIGIKKGEILKKHILNLHPDVDVQYFDLQVVNATDFVDLFSKCKYDFVIDCFDSKDMNLQMDMVNFFEQLKIKYILSGYVNHALFLLYVCEDYSLFKNYFLESYCSFENKKVYSKNRGIIIDSMVFAGIMTNIILNIVVFDSNKDRLFVYDKKNISIYDRLMELKEKYKNFYLNIKNSLEKISVNIIDFKKYDIENFKKINLIQLSKLGSVINGFNVSSKSINNKNNNYLSDIFNEYYSFGNYNFTRDIWLDQMLVRKYHIKELQETIFNFIEFKKSDFLGRLENKNFDIDANYYNVKGINKNEILKFKKELSVDPEKYYKIVNDEIIKLKLYDELSINHNDYFADFDPSDRIFGSYSKMLSFLKMLFNQIELNLGDYFINQVEKYNFIINIYEQKRIGKVIKLLGLKQNIAYSYFDGSYRSLVTLIHEFAHFVFSNNFSDNYFLNNSNIINNEVIAESFLFKILNISNIDFYNNELYELKKCIKYRFFNELSYLFNQMCFISIIDNRIYSGKKLSVDWYNQTMSFLHECIEKDNHYVNKDLFLNNYLINAFIYMPIEETIFKILIIIYSTILKDKILEKAKQGVYLDLDTENINLSLETFLNVFKEIKNIHI